MNTYSIEIAKQMIKDSIKVYLEKDADGNFCMKEVNRLPFFLIGAPGIGKTEMCSQIANELGIGFANCSITHHSRNTVLGLPLITSVNVADREEKYTQYTMSELIGMVYKEVAKGHNEGILLIDEFSCMAESLVAPMLAFLQTKNIGTYTLPEGWVMVLASNPPEYNKNSRKFDMAIMDRVRVMNVVSDNQEFLEYAKTNNFHSAITSFLNQNPTYTNLLLKNPDGNDFFVTSRSWENLSHCLCGMERVNGIVSLPLISQFVKDDGIAQKFFRFYQNFDANLSEKVISSIITTDNVKKIFASLSKFETEDQWKLSKLLFSSLQAQCAGAEKAFFFKAYMENVIQSLHQSCVGNCNPSPVTYSTSKIIAEITERLNSPKSYSNYVWTEPFSQEEGDSLNEIVCLYKKYVTLGDAENDDTALKAFNVWLQKYEKKYQSMLCNDSRAISNCIQFIELFKDDFLLENFMDSINDDNGILEVLSHYHNDVYINTTRRLSANNNLDTLISKIS